MCSEPFSSDLISYTDYQYIINPHARKEKKDSETQVTSFLVHCQIGSDAHWACLESEEAEEGEEGRNENVYLPDQGGWCLWDSKDSYRGGQPY